MKITTKTDTSSIEHLEFKPEIPCSVEDPLGMGAWRPCPNAAIWWQRKPCCGRVAYDCEPHFRLAIDGEPRTCIGCGKSFLPRLAEWGRL